MMSAYETHNIPPHEFKKIGASDWKIIKQISEVTKKKMINERKMKQAQQEAMAEMNARMGGM